MDLVNQTDQSSLLQETITSSQSTAPSGFGFIQQNNRYVTDPTGHTASAQPNRQVTGTQPQVQAINGRSGVMPVLPSMVNFEADRQKLQQQIEELNERHLEAQAKLQQIFSQHQQQPRQQQLQQQQEQQRISQVQEGKSSATQVHEKQMCECISDQ